MFCNTGPKIHFVHSMWQWSEVILSFKIPFLWFLCAQFFWWLRREFCSARAYWSPATGSNIHRPESPAWHVPELWDQAATRSSLQPAWGREFSTKYTLLAYLLRRETSFPHTHHSTKVFWSLQKACQKSNFFPAIKRMRNVCSWSVRLKGGDN